VADDVTVDNATLNDFTVATDDAGGTHVQLFKFASQANASKALVPGDAIDGPYFQLGNISIASTAISRSIHTRLTDSDGNALSFAAPTVVSATPTVTTSVVAAGQTMTAAAFQFASATVSPGGTGHILKWNVYDDSNNGAAIDLWLFDATVTPSAAAKVHSITDADMDNCQGVLRTVDGTWMPSGGGRVFTERLAPPLPYKLAAGTALFGVLVSQASSATYGASDIEVKLHVMRD
jgi:hypothetical protein